jgi:mercuric ion transport protein
MDVGGQATAVERRGRRWILGSLLLCPCHLPVTLGILAAVTAGTALGAFLRDNLVLAGLVITAAWLAGTARGFLLVRMAKRGACPLPPPRRRGAPQR